MYFDAHTHTHFAAFSGDYKEVIARALEAGVGLINVGTQRDTSKRAVEVAHEFEDAPVYATVGLHPIHTEKSYHDAKELGLPSEALAKEGADEKAKEFVSRGEEFDAAYYTELARDPKVVGIGECGLDYYRATGDMEHATWKQKQETAFREQIRLAQEVGKPLMIHCRNAFPDLIRILTTNNSRPTERSFGQAQLTTPSPGVIHFFTGTPDDARQLLDLGFSFTFGGVITFARDYDEVVKLIPMDRILSETDAPYVTPVPYRGKRNEPSYVVEVVKKLAELKGVSVEEMKSRIWENARRVFRIPPE